MIRAYRRRDWTTALSELESCRAQAPEIAQYVYQLYEQRIADLQAAPPPADWDGVYAALMKQAARETLDRYPPTAAMRIGPSTARALAVAVLSRAKWPSYSWLAMSPIRTEAATQLQPTVSRMWQSNGSSRPETPRITRISINVSATA